MDVVSSLVVLDCSIVPALGRDGTSNAEAFCGPIGTDASVGRFLRIKVRRERSCVGFVSWALPLVILRLMLDVLLKLFNFLPVVHIVNLVLRLLEIWSCRSFYLEFFISAIGVRLARPDGSVEALSAYHVLSCETALESVSGTHRQQVVVVLQAPLRSSAANYAHNNHDERERKEDDHRLNLTVSANLLIRGELQVIVPRFPAHLEARETLQILAAKRLLGGWTGLAGHRQIVVLLTDRTP